MKREDNKRLRKYMVYVCFSKLSSGNKYINYMKNAVLIDISFSTETIKYIS